MTSRGSDDGGVPDGVVPDGVRVLDHPLVQHKMAMLRDKDTHHRDFRLLATELSALVGYEAMRDLPLRPTSVETPVGVAEAQKLADDVAIVAVLRAGLIMVDGLLTLVPQARVGHIGLFRDHETLKPVKYYIKLPPDIGDRDVFLVDPMLATGGSAVFALDMLKDAGARRLRLLNLVGAPPGVDAVRHAHPDVPIVLAALDPRLTPLAYIDPGLGDAGDRIYGTR